VKAGKPKTDRSLKLRWKEKSVKGKIRGALVGLRYRNLTHRGSERRETLAIEASGLFFRKKRGKKFHQKRKKNRGSEGEGKTDVQKIQGGALSAKL